MKEDMEIEGDGSREQGRANGKETKIVREGERGPAGAGETEGG